MLKKCDRCGKTGNKFHWRYPHIWDQPSNTCLNAIWSKILVFCEDCQPIFDKLDTDMRLKYLYKDNAKLIKFYEQYVHGGFDEKK